MSGNSCFSLLETLPPQVVSNIVANFCDGKAISTFLLVVECNHRFDDSFFDIIQDALVLRYAEVRKKLRSEFYMNNDGDNEIDEILMVIQDDIRTYDEGKSRVKKKDKMNFSKKESVMAMAAMTRKFSEWCAIVDYFETRMTKTTGLQDQDGDVISIENNLESMGCILWPVWCGPIETSYGTIQAFIGTPHWSAESISFWFQLETLQQINVVRPERPLDYLQNEGDDGNALRALNDDIPLPPSPFGLLTGLNTGDRSLLQRLIQDLSYFGFRTAGNRNCLTTINYAYDDFPPILFMNALHHYCYYQDNQEDITWLRTRQQQSSYHEQSLLCCWDKLRHEDDGIDWEESVAMLGRNIICIMNRLCDQP